VLDWCYGFYNHDRRHSTTGMVSPINYENTAAEEAHDPRPSTIAVPPDCRDPRPAGATAAPEMPAACARRTAAVTQSVFNGTLPLPETRV